MGIPRVRSKDVRFARAILSGVDNSGYFAGGACEQDGKQGERDDHYECALRLLAAMSGELERECGECRCSVRNSTCNHDGNGNGDGDHDYFYKQQGSDFKNLTISKKKNKFFYCIF